MRAWRRTTVAVGLAATLVIAGCSDDGGGKQAVPSSTTGKGTAGRRPKHPVASTCALTSIDEVRTTFGGPVASDLSRGRCQYRVPGGFVRFQQWTGPGTVSTLAPGGVEVKQLGTTAIWAPAPGDGGVLAVQVGRDLLVFEGALGLSADQTKSRLVGWARSVVARYEADGVTPAPTTTTPSGTSVPSSPVLVCDLITIDEIAGVTGAKASAVTLDDGDDVCTYTVARVGSFTVGPITSPVTADILDQVDQTSMVDGKRTPWPRTELMLGEGAVLLSNPTMPGQVELYVIARGDLFHFSASVSNPVAAEKMATAIATISVSR